jgi:hypothetical protein
LTFITAPSMTTPAEAYFHRATRSFRASATTVALRIRPLAAPLMFRHLPSAVRKRLSKLSITHNFLIIFVDLQIIVSSDS